MTKISSNKNNFVTITNQDIYNEIKSLHDRFDVFSKTNQIEHNNIIQKQSFTNGKVKLNRWMSTTAISLVIIIIGLLFNHISRG